MRKEKTFSCIRPILIKNNSEVCNEIAHNLLGLGISFKSFNLNTSIRKSSRKQLGIEQNNVFFSYFGWGRSP